MWFDSPILPDNNTLKSFKSPILSDNDDLKSFKDLIPIHLKDEISNYANILNDNQDIITSFIHDGDLSEDELNRLDDFFREYNMNIVDIHNYNNKLIQIIKYIEENDIKNKIDSIKYVLNLAGFGFIPFIVNNISQLKDISNKMNIVTSKYLCTKCKLRYKNNNPDINCRYSCNKQLGGKNNVFNKLSLGKYNITKLN